MNILVVGSGGREHAIVHAITRSSGNHVVISAPGNAGTADLGSNVAIAADDLDGIREFVTLRKIDLVVVGPEVPLVLGLADWLREDGVLVLGPSSAAARLEGSKIFAKEFMDRHDIPTASYKAFQRGRKDDALVYVETHGAPIVVKASGLAAGKGAIVCMTEAEAHEAVDFILRDNSLGSAGDEIVLESFMTGEEASVFALTDGEHYVLLPSAQDHKRIGEGDTGPNTGGMGAYAPAPLVTEEILHDVCVRIIEPTLKGMQEEGCAYSGVLYCGLMMTSDGPKVVEYNCRLGDPEAQVVLPLLKSDAVELFLRTANGTLDDYEIEWMHGAAASVVLASGGYPDAYEKGKVIYGVEEAAALDNTFVYMAGVERSGDGDYVTSGGRVLAVTGLGSDLSVALERAYQGVHAISFNGRYYRQDIGEKGLARLALS